MDLNEKNINIESLKEMLEGRHVSQNKIQVGYTPETDHSVRILGEKWTDADGNEWERRDGYSVKLGKEWQQELHSYLNGFKNCPKEQCTCTLPKKLDKKMNTIHGMCFDCVIDMEHKLKIEGKYKDYEKDKMKQNAIAWVAQAEKDKDYIIEELIRSKFEFVNSNGLVEKWVSDVNVDELKEKIETEFQKFKEETLLKLEEFYEGQS